MKLTPFLISGDIIILYDRFVKLFDVTQSNNHNFRTIIKPDRNDTVARSIAVFSAISFRHNSYLPQYSTSHTIKL